MSKADEQRLEAWAMETVRLRAGVEKLVDEMRTSGMYAYNFVHKLESLLSAPAPVEMTIERAVEILNERKHNGYSQWEVYSKREVWAGDADEIGDAFTHADAITIATAYTRKEGSDAK